VAGRAPQSPLRNSFKDDDGNAASQPSNDRPGPVVTQDQADTLQALAEDVGADLPKFLKYFGVTALKAVPAAKYAAAVAALEAKRKQEAA